MILPTPGANPASRLFGYATPPDGAGPIGPDQLWPTPVTATPEEMQNALNPVHYLPGIGMIYRAVTGEQIPTAIRVLGAGILGGPVGVLLAGFTGVLMGLLTMEPDTSRPTVPAGMSATGSEIGMTPVTPGTLAPGEYTTLATTVPEWLQSPIQTASTARAVGAYQQTSQEWAHTQALEKGLT
jgi:hypothetical protein